jgi:hypothetical protein
LQLMQPNLKLTRTTSNSKRFRLGIVLVHVETDSVNLARAIEDDDATRSFEGVICPDARCSLD